MQKFKKSNPIPVRTRLVIDETGNKYKAIVPKECIIPEDDFEEVSIDGSSAPVSEKPKVVEEDENSIIYTCKKCKIFFSELEMLSTHMRTEHRKYKIPPIFNSLLEKARRQKILAKKANMAILTKKANYALVSPSLTVTIQSRVKDEPETGKKEKFDKMVVPSKKCSRIVNDFNEEHNENDFVEKKEELINDAEMVDSCSQLMEGDLEYANEEVRMDMYDDNEDNTEYVQGGDDIAEEDAEFTEGHAVVLENSAEFDENTGLIVDGTVMSEINPNIMEQAERLIQGDLELMDEHTGLIEDEGNSSNYADNLEYVDYNLEDGPEEFVYADELSENADVSLTEQQEADGSCEKSEVASGVTAPPPIVVFQDKMLENEDYTCSAVEITGEKTKKGMRMFGKVYHCAYCTDFECKSKNALYIHLSTTHKEWTIAAARREAARLRLEKQRGPLNFKCFYCSFAASNRSTLCAHSRRKHPGLIQPPPTRKKGPRILPWKCTLCDFTSNCKRKHHIHTERKHVTELRYNCQQCPKKFKTQCDLSAHVKFQHIKSPIICEVCGKVCLNNNALHVHQKREHYLPQFECNICHRRMVSQANLDEHIFKQHENRTKYMCESCGKVFDQQSKLATHRRTHTGEKPHPCPTCGKCFARRAVLRQHMMIHTGERPYICDICGKRFAQKPGLICHRKSHPGEKPPLPVVYIDHILKRYERESGLASNEQSGDDSDSQ